MIICLISILFEKPVSRDNFTIRALLISLVGNMFPILYYIIILTFLCIQRILFQDIFVTIEIRIIIIGHLDKNRIFKRRIVFFDATHFRFKKKKMKKAKGQNEEIQIDTWTQSS
jgi:hypothetical protein